MAVDDRLKRTSQGVNFQPPLQLDRCRYVVRRVVRIHLLDKVQASLRVRHLILVASFYSRDHPAFQSFAVIPILRQELRKLCHLLAFEQLNQRKFYTKLTLDPRSNLHCFQRMAAKCEEVVLDPDRLAFQNFLPDRT